MNAVETRRHIGLRALRPWRKCSVEGQLINNYAQLLSRRAIAVLPSAGKWSESVSVATD
ncbi:hypothetical protein H6F86_28855 [Phormidium sp. FACHB-592]|uniref:Transposase n=1 Tax=Stenomitos frigidus AS-A4 TaxID=2933935 RepID=A0ABV0KD93_9CYAN|nr:hypothetical protein [Phormidium sp. FACHB-592]